MTRAGSGHAAIERQRRGERRASGSARRPSHRIVLLDLREEKRRFLRGVGALLFLSVFLVVVMSFATTSDARGDLTAPRIKYYTSVQIQKGDNLWDLCSDYMSGEYKDARAYIREVKSLNHLTTDHITEGSFLVLPYYSSTIKE